jgi:3-methylfumaryl-CoA hydratase
MTHPATPPIDAATLHALRQWVGRETQVQDTVTAAPLDGLAATLDHDGPPARHGDRVPPLGHWLYFLPHARQSELGPDGHPRRGGFLPPVPLPRRMWAGGSLRWQAANPLRVGDHARRHSLIAAVDHKTGRSGELVFVQVQHRIENAHGLALTETHDIVYRSAPQPGAAVPAAQPAPQGAQWSRTVVPDDVLLFRYSALTFNGHRIHYDRRYVTQEEGYPGLVVHGPLIATLLLDLLHRHQPRAWVVEFDYKVLRPTFDPHPFSVHGRLAESGHHADLWACGPDGAPTLQGRATLLPG